MNRRMFSFLTNLKEYHKSILKIWGLRTNYCEMPLYLNLNAKAGLKDNAQHFLCAWLQYVQI